jgi:hypothetical protein
MGLDAEVQVLAANVGELNVTVDNHGGRLVRLEKHPQACADSELACRAHADRAERAAAELKAENATTWESVKAHFARQQTAQTGDIMRSQALQIAAMFCVTIVVGLGFWLKLDGVAIGVGVAAVLGGFTAILSRRKPTDPPAGGGNPNANGALPPGGAS